MPIDFEVERLEDRAAVHSKAFFIWEGVTQYVSRAAVDDVLRWVARAPRGSELVFTYVPLEVIEGRSMLFGAAAAKSASKRAPWITGFDPALLGQELDGLGLELCEDCGAAEHRARYLAPIGRSSRCSRSSALPARGCADYEYADRTAVGEGAGTSRAFPQAMGITGDPS